MPKRRKRKQKKFINKIIILVISLLLGIFFILWGKAHIFLANFIPHLHFCSYFACVIFSLIWFAFAGISIYFLTKKKKKMGRIWYIPMGVILFIGIILMNLTSCDTDGIHFGFGAGGYFAQSTVGTTDTCKPGVDCLGDVIEVPIPPCIETDDGQDYITPGMILSGADIEDVCMSSDLLRERYCNSELTYTSEDVSCSDMFGADWICEDRECILDTTPVVTPPGDGGSNEDNAALCDDELDNDGDGDIDCADSDCVLYCEECSHSLDFPDCNAICDSGSCEPIYAETDGWCACLPDGETSCHASSQIGEEPPLGSTPLGDSGAFCDGWCEELQYCIYDIYDLTDNSCYCDSFQCTESDGGYFPEVAGSCFDDGGWHLDYCDFDDAGGDTLIEYECLGTSCQANIIDCTIFEEGDGTCIDADDYAVADYCGLPT